MTKNTKTILLSLLACLLLITGFELGEGRIRFGGARLNDSTATYITTNKSFIVNGTMKATDSLVASGILSIGALEFDVSGTITFNYGSMIQEDAIDQLSTYANTHKFKTEYGTEIGSLDSASGLSHQVVRNDASWNGARIGYKFLRTVAPTGNSTVTVAHGLTDGRIIDARIWLRHDTTYTTAYHTARNWYVQPGASYDATILYYAGYDSLYCFARFPAAATATRGDSLYFLLTYWQ